MKKNSSIEVLISACITSKKTFVIYRKPYTSDVYVMLDGQVYPSSFKAAIGKKKDAFYISPFDNKNAPSYIYIPTYCFCADKIPEEIFSILEKNKDSSEWLKSGCEKEDYDEYANNFQKLHHQIKQGTLGKVVLSRRKFISTITIFNASTMFVERLKQEQGFVYLMHIPSCGVWLGSSPEVLLEVNDNMAHTMSLAGSKAADDMSDWSKKELDEQRIVTDYIMALVNDMVEGKKVEKKGPHTVSLRGVSHLQTDFLFPTDALNDRLESFLDRLHPTPAVCGYPKELAKQSILSVERHERALYAGFLGPMYKNGSFSFFVNLRCVQFLANGAYVYVGGGLTAQSEMESEFKETELKLASVLGS